MTIHRAKGGRLFGAAMLVLLFTASAANAWGGDGCVPFKLTFQGSFLPYATPTMPYGGWALEGYFIIGGLPLHAKLEYPIDDIVGTKVTKNIFRGTEKGIVTFDGGGTFDLVSHFTSPHQTFKDGFAVINESGTVGNGTGRFANVSGHFTAHGIYGPAVPHSPDSPVGDVGSMDGNICGVSIAGLTAKTN